MNRAIATGRGGKRGKDISTKIRANFVRALDINTKRGKPLDLIIADSLVENLVGTLKAMSYYCPKDLLTEASKGGITINVVNYGTQEPIDVTDIIEPTKIARVVSSE